MTKNETESTWIPRDETLHAYEEHLSCGYRFLLDPFDSSFDPTNASARHHPKIQDQGQRHRYAQHFILHSKRQYSL